MAGGQSGIEPMQHTYHKQQQVGGPGPFTQLQITFAQAGNATANLITPLAGPFAINTATTAQLLSQARFDALCLILSRYGRPVGIQVKADSSSNAGNVVVFTFEGTQEGIFGAAVNLAPNSMSIPAPATGNPATTLTDGSANGYVGTYGGQATSATSFAAPLGTPPFYYVSKTLPGVGANASATGSLLAQLLAVNHDPSGNSASALFTGSTPFLYNSDTQGVSAGGITFTGSQITAAFI